MVTVAPTCPVGGVIPVTTGLKTPKLNPLLATPPTVTTILPVVAPVGTFTVIEVDVQHVPQGVAGVPLKVTVLVPCVAPKFDPVIVTEAPIAPDAGERFEIVGEVPQPLKLMDTLSKVAEPSVELLPPLAPNPIYTFWLMGIESVDPTCVHVLPSGAV